MMLLHFPAFFPPPPYSPFLTFMSFILFCNQLNLTKLMCDHGFGIVHGRFNYGYTKTMSALPPKSTSSQ